MHRLKPRNRNRLLVLGGILYLAVFLWALSPLWGSDAPHEPRSPKVRALSRGKVGGSALAETAGVPARLPGSGPVGAAETTAPAVEGEPVSAEPETFEPTSEAASPVESGGSSQSSAGGGGSEGKTVIGFEG